MVKEGRRDAFLATIEWDAAAMPASASVREIVGGFAGGFALPFPLFLVGIGGGDVDTSS